MRDIARQLRNDFTTLPALVDEYVVHTPRSEAIKAARQVAGVTHYLSLMATGDVDMHKCAQFGVLIVCIDEVTDELGRELCPTPITDALLGSPPFASLRVVGAANDRAENSEFAFAVKEICRAQDDSLAQLDDIDVDEVMRITRAKGGWSAEANLKMVKQEVTDEEREFIAEFGFLMQMLDDYLDQPKDRANGLSTPFTVGEWDGAQLSALIDITERDARRVWGRTDAGDRFFDICRLHKRLGDVENNTRLSASTLAPGYL